MEQNKINKPKLIGLIAGAAGFILAWLLVQHFLFSPPSFDKQLVQAAEEINKTCPFTVDSETRLDNAVALPGNTLQYNYTMVNYSMDEIDTSEFRKNLEPSLLESIKTSSGMKVFRENGATLIYCYKDKKGAELLKLHFQPASYQ